MQLAQDIRYAFRQLRRNPGFAASLGFSRITSSVLSGVDVHNAAQTDPMQALRHE